jgi:iron complex outermembrane receptor protein
MHRVSTAFLALLLTAFTAFAGEEQQVARTEDKELEDLLSIVQQETEVATKTKMNSDYVPGIVTVLEGDDLEALGIVTAGEALGLVPGMFAVRDRLANPSVISRGLDFPFNAGNILILINSIPLSRPDAGITTSALLIPVEQIERIEVIRGPGSVVYGDFAFMGLVNIVTRKEGTRLYARVARPNTTRDVGGRTSFEAGGSKFSASASRFNSTNFGGPRGVNSADDDRWMGVATYERGRFSLAAQGVHRGYNGHSGGANFDETSGVLDAKYAMPLRAKLDATIRATFLNNDIAETVSRFNGHLLRLGADVVWGGMSRNSWLGGVDYTTSTVDDAFFAPAPPPGQPPIIRRVAHDRKRRITGVYLQDRIDVRPNVSITLGGRLDSYSDLDSRFTPRAAIAWRITDSHIIKAQYAEGFRPPTFFEQFSAVPPGQIPRYYFETNSTTELNYVYRAAGRVGRVTLFHEIITNMIRPGGVITDPNAKADGVEVEWSQQIGAPLKVDANVSYTETEDPRSAGAGFPTRPDDIAPKWLGNLSLFYRPIHGVVTSAHLSHVGERPRGAGFDLVDFTVTKQDVIRHGIDLRAGLKNAFDQSQNYLFVAPQNNQTNVFRYPGRTYWVQVSWKR